MFNFRNNFYILAKPIKNPDRTNPEMIKESITSNNASFLYMLRWIIANINNGGDKIK